MKKLIILLFMYISIIGFSTDYEGTWEKASYITKGNWSIVSKSDGNYLILDKDFKTKKGPDIYILLSPKEFEKVTDKNAHEDAYFIVKLEKFKGEQTFKIKDDINISDYKSILIHCIEYSHLWSGSDIDK